MGDWVTIISLVLGFLGSGGVAVSTLLFRKATKRLKNAEAVSAEIESLRATISELRSQITFCETRIETLQKLLIDKDVYISAIYADKNALEIKHARNKSAINKAYECTFCSDHSKCPVIVQRTANEENYLRTLEKTH